MRASTGQVRHATIDAVDAARQRAGGLVGTGAEVVGQTIDRGASVVEGGIERVAEKAPSVSFGRAEPPPTHRLRTPLISLAVMAVVVAVVRRLTAASTEPTPSSAPAPTIPSDDDAEPVQAGSG